MRPKQRVDLFTELYIKCKSENGHNWVLITFFEPEKPYTTIKIGVFYSIGQILSQFKKDDAWLVNEKYGQKIVSELTRSDFLPMRSSNPPKFAYGSALQKLEDVADFYEKKAELAEKELEKERAKNSADEPKQLTAPKDPKNRPN